jgi:putative ATP-dependent endonuclease of OLD family
MDYCNFSAEEKIVVRVEIRQFDDDLDVLATLTDCRLDDDPDTVG